MDLEGLEQPQKGESIGAIDPNVARQYHASEYPQHSVHILTGIESRASMTRVYRSKYGR